MNNQHPWPLKKSKSWGPFWSYQLNSTAISAYPPRKWAKWAELAVLFSWQLQNGPQDFDFFNCPGCRIFIFGEIHCQLCPPKVDMIIYSQLVQNPINPISTNYEKKEAENSFHIGRFSINFLAHKYAAKQLINEYLLTHLFQNEIDLHYLNIVMAALWTFCQHDNHNCQMNVNSMV